MAATGYLGLLDGTKGNDRGRHNKSMSTVPDPFSIRDVASSEVNMAHNLPTDTDGQLRLVLDNMPGALIYTDANQIIVVCNDRFKEMYRVPQELLQPGRPYSDFLRHLAENGFYGEGDVDALVAKRVESLRNPSGVSSRTTRRMAGGIATSATGRQVGARSP